jgi:hypothetical protein
MKVKLFADFKYNNKNSSNNNNNNSNEKQDKTYFLVNLLINKRLKQIFIISKFHNWSKF